MRDRNERHVLQALLESTYVTQTEIAQRAGLSRATVSDIVKALEASGLINRREMPRTTAASAGRPPKTISLDPDAGTVLGLDIGRDHIRLVAGGLADGPDEIRQVAADEGLRFEVSERPEKALPLAIGWMRRWMEAEGRSWDRLVGIGVSLAGPVDHDRVDLATPSVMRAWRGIPIAEELRNRLGVNVPVLIENDASLGALAELHWGAARDHRHVLYLKCSSGIGAGLILDGELFHGARGFAGELGHTLIPGREVADSPLCTVCGNCCLEQVASPKAITLRLGMSYSNDAFKAVADAARNEDERGKHRKAFAAAAQDLGRALANVVDLLNPELILIGGQLGEHGFDLSYDGLVSELRRTAYAPTLDGVVVRRAERRRSGPAEGAVLLVLQEELASFLQRRLDTRSARKATPAAGSVRRPTHSATARPARSSRAASKAA